MIASRTALRATKLAASSPLPCAVRKLSRAAVVMAAQKLDKTTPDSDWKKLLSAEQARAAARPPAAPRRARRRRAAGAGGGGGVRSHTRAGAALCPRGPAPPGRAARGAALPAAASAAIASPPARARAPASSL